MARLLALIPRNTHRRVRTRENLNPSKTNYWKMDILHHQIAEREQNRAALKAKSKGKVTYHTLVGGAGSIEELR